MDRLPLKDTKVTVNISGMIADIRVAQTYANEGSHAINASYVFPASTKVTVHGMTMQVGNQIVTARIKEKEEAKEKFEAAKSEGKNASLLEEKEANVFSMSVANIMPGDVISIELHYTELISPSDGIYQFVFPTVVGPRYVSPVLNDGGREEWAAIPYFKEGSSPADTYSIDVRLSSGVPISALRCNSHEVDVDWQENTNAHITLANPAEYAGNRDFILDYCLMGEEIQSGLLLDTNGTENFFMLTLQPPKRVEAAQIPSKEYIFVLDVSGSMFGFPLDTAKELIRDLVSGLTDQDTFNLVLFSDKNVILSPVSLPATAGNMKRAIDLIDAQDGRGGTELTPALEDALAIRSDGKHARTVVLITDGFIYGEDKIFDIIADNMEHASFFPFGIGSSVNRNLIEGIAEIGQGEPFVVTDKDEAAIIAERFRTYISSPVLTDIQVRFDGFDVYDVEPAVLPTLFAEKPLVLLGKYRGEASGTVTVTGKTAIGAYSSSLNLAEAADGICSVAPARTDLVPSGSLSYLWARKRVARLTAYGMNKDNPDVKEEVTKIGLAYSMLTPYTSFIAVSEVVRNPDGESTDVEQSRPLPLHVSNLSVGYTIGAEPEWFFGPALASALILGYLKWRKKSNFTAD